MAGVAGTVAAAIMAADGMAGPATAAVADITAAVDTPVDARVMLGAGRRVAASMAASVVAVSMVAAVASVAVPVASMVAAASTAVADSMVAAVASMAAVGMAADAGK
jgi:hypothetical protein